MHHSSQVSMATKGEIKLLGTAASPFVNRGQFVLNLKSIDYELIIKKLVPQSELLLTSNPVHKKIPVLFHANKPPISESLIIIEYLDEIYPNIHQILPSDPLHRAHNRSWAYYIDNTFFALLDESARTPGKHGRKAIKKQIMEASQLLEGAFVKCSKGKPYFGGDNIRYLDVVLGGLIGLTGFVGKINDFKIFDEIRTPGLAGWETCMRSHEAIKSVIPGFESIMILLKQKIRIQTWLLLNDHASKI